MAVNDAALSDNKHQSGGKPLNQSTQNLQGAAIRHVQERQQNQLKARSKSTFLSNIMKVGRKSVPGGWTGVEEATFTKSCSGSWQNIGL